MANQRYAGNAFLEQTRQKVRNVSYVVLGDIMLDRYIYGEVGRISPEAPVPIVNVKKTKENLGGAANVAMNLKCFGGTTYLCGVIGKDVMGNMICNMLENEGIVYSGLTLKDRMTTSKNRIVGKGQQIVRFDEEICDPLSDQETSMILSQLDLFMDRTNLIVISDYAKGVCTSGLCSLLISKANSHHIRVVVDPKGIEWEKYSGAYIVTPNWKEFTEIAGAIEPEDDIEIQRKALKLLEKYQLENILITRSERGMTLVSKNLYLSFAAEAREISDVSGAGDTVIAALAAFLAADVPLEESVYWANRAAGLAVERAGTSVIGIEELIREQGDLFNQMNYTQKLKNLEELQEQLLAQRKENNKIVFTNGCFDILHMGHIQYLNEAKALGDFLVVAVNTDHSVKRLNKGDNRPVNGEMDRALQIAALQMVDAVILFDEDTPLELLEQIQPDILVKGGDYQPEQIVGREYAGETKVLSLKKGYSTTRLIEKLQCGRMT